MGLDRYHLRTLYKGWSRVYGVLTERRNQPHYRQNVKPLCNSNTHYLKVCSGISFTSRKTAAELSVECRRLYNYWHSPVHKYSPAAGFYSFLFAQIPEFLNSQGWVPLFATCAVQSKKGPTSNKDPWGIAHSA